MADRVTTGLYAFDPAGTNPANRITNERQTLVTPNIDDYYFIIPFAAPFFVDSLELRNDQTNALYVEGVDYLVGHYFVEAMDSVGRPVAGSIRFIRRDIGGVIKLKYHTIGGVWGFNDNAILEELSNRQFNPLERSWGMISGLPATFPPLPHDQSVDDLVGSDDLLEGLDSIAEAIQAASEGSTAAHLEDYSNPHRVTKAQVGLGAVDNFATATAAQARGGIADNAFMTPVRTAQAIEKLLGEEVDAHKDDTSNPHRVTAEQIGLGQVQNFPMASESDAVDPTRNDRYLTPYTAYLLLQQAGEGGNVTAIQTLLAAHVENKANPHEVTAEQVGAYTRADVDQLLANYVAANTELFNGLSEEEWRASLPTFDNITEVIDFLQEEYEQAGVTIGSVGTALTLPEPKPVPISVHAGFGRYVVARSEGDAVIIPPVPEWSAGRDSTPERYAFNSTAHYYITDEGLIDTYNLGNAILPPASFRAGSSSPIAANVTNIIARDDVLFILMDDDILHRVTRTGSSVVDTGIESAHSVLSGPEKLVLVRTDGTAYAIGDNNYGTAMTTALSSLVDIDTVAVSTDETYVLFTDGRLRCWSHTVTGGTVTVDTVVLPLELANNITTVSAGGSHAVILDDQGFAHGRGDNTYGQLDIIQAYGPFVEVGTHTEYTVTVSADGAVYYWGEDDTNSLLPTANRLGV